MSGLSNDMQNITQGKEDISNAASGHKANLSNPNTSQESKENSKAELEKLGGEDAFYGKKGDTTSASAKENLEQRNETEQ